MQKIIDRLSVVLTDKRFLTASVSATLALYAVNFVAKLLCGLYSLFIIDIVFFLCVAALFAAYRRHNKNMQKGLPGAILMWYFYKGPENAAFRHFRGLSARYQMVSDRLIPTVSVRSFPRVGQRVRKTVSR